MAMGVRPCVRINAHSLDATTGAAEVRIELPWPPTALWPNRRAHWGKKSRTAQKARADAHTLTFQAWWGAADRERGHVQMLIEHGERIPVNLTFCPPTRHKYDVDNALAACKSMLDGVADGIAVDDSKFQLLTLERSEVVKGGKVIVEIAVLPVSRRFEDQPWSSV
jgi:crossover junction endodeoxyribonuclease RusA